MAIIVQINKTDKNKKLESKLTGLSVTSFKKKFDAPKYTGKIKSFGDGLAYQKKLRNEWN